MARTLPVALQYEMVYNYYPSENKKERKNDKSVSYRIQYPFKNVPARNPPILSGMEEPCRVKISDLSPSTIKQNYTKKPKTVAPQCELVYNWETGRSEVIFKKDPNNLMPEKNNREEQNQETVADDVFDSKYYFPEEEFGFETHYFEAVSETPGDPSQFETVVASVDDEVNNKVIDERRSKEHLSGRLVYDQPQRRGIGRSNQRAMGINPDLAHHSQNHHSYQRPRAIYDPATHRASLHQLAGQKRRGTFLEKRLQRVTPQSTQYGKVVINGQMLKLNPKFVDDAEAEFLKARPIPKDEGQDNIDEQFYEDMNPEDLESKFCEEFESLLGAEIENRKRSGEKIENVETTPPKRIVMIGDADELESPSTSSHVNEVVAVATPEPVREPGWAERDQEILWKLIFSYLPRKTLCNSCMIICRNWHDWIINCASIWREIDLQGRQDLTDLHWKSIGRRRPEKLNLAWTNVAKSDLELLLTYCDRLNNISLAGCHFSTVNGMESIKLDLSTLDLRWCHGCTDGNFKDLISSTPQLKNLVCLYLAGCDVGDATSRLLANQFPRLRSLDLSYCSRITNLTLEVLSAAGSRATRQLTHLNLAGCKLDETIFGAVQKMQSLTQLDLRACDQFTETTCKQFEEACGALGRNLTVLR